MKKQSVLVSVFCTISFFSLFGQIQKGGHLISSSLSFSISQSKNGQTGGNNLKNKGNQLGIYAGYSKMITDNWAVGGGLNFSTEGNTNDVFYYINTSIEQYTLKTQRRYANVSAHATRFYPLGDNHKWFASVTGAVNYGFSSNKSDTIRTTGTKSLDLPRSNAVSLSLTPSLAYAFSKHLFAQANLGYLSFGTRWSTQYNQTGVDLYLYPSWGSFGFLYYW